MEERYIKVSVSSDYGIQSSRIKNVTDQFIYYKEDFDKKLSIAPTGWCKSELIFQAKDYCVKRIKRTEKWQKFDIDAILSAWMLGIEDYMLNTNKILTSYEEVGRVFPAAYLN